MSRAERYQQRQQVECGLRVVDGAQQCLGTHFKHGLASLEPGAISFMYYVGGVRFLRHKPVRVAVVAVDRTDQRSVRFSEQFSAMPGFHIIRVFTGLATLEWVLPPEQTAWAAQQVKPQ